MPTTFFIADTHFGDAHILRQRGAAFATIAAHDAALVAAWNDRIAPTDDVWHLGDVASGLARDACVALFDRLNGVKRLVRGNHDTNRVLDLPWAAPPVENTRLTVKDESGREWRLFLSHYPHRSWPGLWRGTRHLHGHTHARLTDTTRSCDVGVDAWGWAPVPLAAAMARMDAAPSMPEELDRAQSR